MRSRHWVLAAMVLASGVFVSVAIIVGSFALAQTRGRAQDVAQAVRALTAQTVRARYDDCLGANRIRGALSTQVLQAKRSDPVLYKLLPSLNTATVHAIVKAERAQQLKAFAPVNCHEFALAAVPPGQRSQYQIP